MLADDRAATEAHLNTLRCPTCQQKLNPFTGPTQCPCGTVVWQPTMWTGPIDAVRGVLAYLDGTPDADRTLDIVTVAIGMTSGWEYDDLNVTGCLVVALGGLAPNVMWSAMDGRLTAVVPTGATFIGGDAAALLAIAERLGYDLEQVVDHWNQIASVTIRFAADSPAEGMPLWFTLGQDADGQWLLCLGAPSWDPVGGELHPGVDIDEVEDWARLHEGPTPDDWTVNVSYPLFPDGSCIEAETEVTTIEMSADVLQELLGSGMQAVAEIRRAMDDRYGALVAEQQ